MSLLFDIDLDPQSSITATHQDIIIDGNWKQEKIDNKKIKKKITDIFCDILLRLGLTTIQYSWA